MTIDKTMNSATSQDGAVTFTGNYDYRTFAAADKSILFLGTENTLFYPEAGAGIGPFRCYFDISAITSGTQNGGNPIRQFKLGFGGDATEVISLHPSPEGAGEVFDLSGRRINGIPTAKGIYRERS